MPLALDVDRHPELFRRFGGRAIPMIVWARPDGTKVKGIVGYRSPAAFLREFPE